MNSEKAAENQAINKLNSEKATDDSVKQESESQREAENTFGRKGNRKTAVTNEQEMLSVVEKHKNDRLFAKNQSENVQVLSPRPESRERQQV